MCRTILRSARWLDYLKNEKIGHWKPPHPTDRRDDRRYKEIICLKQQTLRVLRRVFVCAFLLFSRALSICSFFKIFLCPSTRFPMTIPYKVSCKSRNAYVSNVFMLLFNISAYNTAINMTTQATERTTNANRYRIIIGTRITNIRDGRILFSKKKKMEKERINFCLDYKAHHIRFA